MLAWLYFQQMLFAWFICFIWFIPAVITFFVGKHIGSFNGYEKATNEYIERLDEFIAASHEREKSCEELIAEFQRYNNALKKAYNDMRDVALSWQRAFMLKYKSSKPEKPN